MKLRLNLFSKFKRKSSKDESQQLEKYISGLRIQLDQMINFTEKRGFNTYP